MKTTLTKRLTGMILAAAMICALFTSGASTVGASAAAASVEAWINYEEEVIEVSADAEDDDIVMYSIGKKTFDVAKAKWYPMVGSGDVDADRMDISKIIPKKDSIIIGFKLLSDTANARVEQIPVKARPSATNLKSVAKTFGTDFKFTDGVEFKIGVMTEYQKMETGLGAEDQAKLMANYNKPDFYPSGASGVMRYMAFEHDSDSGRSSFASLEVKFKIKAPPKAPKVEKIGIDTAKTPNIIKGIDDKMEVYIGANSDPAKEWATLKKDMKVTEFDALFTSDSTSKVTNDKNYDFTIRFKEVSGKKSASSKAVMSLPKADYDKAMASTTK